MTKRGCRSQSSRASATKVLGEQRVQTVRTCNAAREQILRIGALQKLIEPVQLVTISQKPAHLVSKTYLILKFGVETVLRLSL